METLKNKLKELKLLGCSGIKVSFEDEGAQMNEVMSMRYLTASVGLELSLKIGGCEAKRDIIEAIHIGCDTIVAPMIESEFAFNKFIKAVETCEYKNKLSCNIESKVGVSNFFNIKNLNRIDSITFGRVDFTESYGLTRNDVDNEFVYNNTLSVFSHANINELFCNLGGGININSKPFIHNLIKENKLDYFETRYVIFKTSNINIENYDILIRVANEFEIEWLKYIQSRYMRYQLKDDSRIKMIELRVKENNI